MIVALDCNRLLLSSEQDLEYNISSWWIAKNTLWVYAAAILIAPMQYIIRILVAKNLPLDQVGLIYSLLSLTGILAIYNDLWFREAIGYFYPQYLAKRDYNKSKTLIVTTLWIQIITSLLLAGALYLMSDYIAVHYLKDPTGQFIVQVFWVYLLFYILLGFVDGLFMIFQNAYWNKLITIINYIILVWFVVLVPYGIFEFLGVKSLMTGYTLAHIAPSIISIMIGVLVFWRMYYKTVSLGNFEWDWWEYKKIQTYALVVLFTNNILYLISQIDLQFMTFLFGTSQAGLYSYGMMVSNLIVTLLAPIAGLLYPLISHLRARDRQETMEKLLYALINYLWVLSLLWSLFLFTFSTEIVTLLFGATYHDAWLLIKRNLLFVAFATLNVILFSIYAGLGLAKKRVKMLAVVLVLSIIGNIVLSRFMGPNGIALATWLTRCVIFIYGYIDLRKEWIPLHIDTALLTKNLLVAVVGLSLIKFWLPYVVDIHVNVIWSVLISGTAYVAIVWLSNLWTIKNAITVAQQFISLKAVATKQNEPLQAPKAPWL